MPFGAEDTLKVNIIGDASKLKGALSEADIGIAKFAEKVGSIGKTMTLIGAAITAVSVGLVKMASDAEETASKFAVVFQDVSEEAAKTAKNLADNFGLSSNKAKQLLSDTGDLLTGFGFTGKAALDLSTKVNELAVDLASFTNFSGGAEGASRALTKALLGERESVKSLGISIMETDVQAKVLQLTQQGLTFETDRQAKAYATLLIAQEQSKNAIGDFSRTSEGFANQIRILKAKLEDLAIALGEKILPIATKLVGKIIEIVEKINKWIEAHPKLVEWIVKTGAVLGGLALIGGPILMAVSAFMKMKVIMVAISAFSGTTFIPSLISIKGTLLSLGTISTGPIGLLIIAIGGLYAAWKTNLFGMRDRTIEVVDMIKAKIKELRNEVKLFSEALGEGGGGGAAGAFFEEGLPETIPPILGEDEEAKDAIEKLEKAIKEVNDRLYELTHTTMENAIKKLDEQRQAYIDLGVAIGLVNDWYDEEIKKLNDLSEAYDTFLDAMKTVEDRMFELTHTQREVEIRKLDEKKAKLIEVAKQAGLSADDEIAAIQKIIDWYKKEIALLDEKEKKYKKGMYRVYTKAGEHFTSITAEEVPYYESLGYVFGETIKPSPVSYQVGTSYVPKTGPYILHEGEGVLKREENINYNQQKREINININNPVVRNDDDIIKIKQQVDKAFWEFIRQYGRRGFELAI